jgi:hypothetical protein
MTKLKKAEWKYIISATCALFLIPLLVMWAWNYTMVAVFAAPVLGYWHSFLMLFISGHLFKNDLNLYALAKEMKKLEDLAE